MMLPQQQQRPDVVAERAAFQEAQASLLGHRLIFVDESGIRQGERSTYGYAPRGERCVERAPYRVGRRVSLIGWMSSFGGRFAQYTGSVTGEVFERFVSKALVPHLQKGDIVIWDNARVHTAKARQMVESRGARVLALPRYSPELNAIEPLWSKLKGWVRKQRADTAESLRAAVSASIGQLRYSDALGWIKHCGYLCQP